VISSSLKQEFPKQNWKWTPIISIIIAFGMAVLLFMLIPLTQSLNSTEEKELLVREVVILAAPPPPPPPPEEAETPPPIPPPLASRLPSNSEAVEVEPLDLVFISGNSEAVAMGIAPPTLQIDRDRIGDIERFFTFEDLPVAPRLIHTPSFRFPAQLVRRGITEGEVVVEIDILENGQARLHRIVSSTHRDLEPIAREIVERARFTKPMIDGRPQTVRGLFPISLQN
jgi:TonB family protein